MSTYMEEKVTELGNARQRAKIQCQEGRHLLTPLLFMFFSILLRIFLIVISFLCVLFLVLFSLFSHAFYYHFSTLPLLLKYYNLIHSHLPFLFVLVYVLIPLILFSFLFILILKPP